MLAFYSNYYEINAMRSPRIPVEEQYRLIMECRQSGLSDHQWCLNKGINLGTFYNWVKRLRQNNCCDIPERNQLADRKVIQQEVAKIEMNAATPIDFVCTNTMDLMIGNLKLCIPNGTDLVLLAQTIKILTEYAC